MSVLIWHEILLTNFQRRVQYSRASVAALCTVLWMTMLSYGNIQYSGTCQTETSQPIATKFCVIDHVGEVS
jgi:hypothetical protein